MGRGRLVGFVVMLMGWDGTHFIAYDGEEFSVFVGGCG
jgi:hypothetical protein